MPSHKAITKLQTILIIDLIIVASAAAGFFYVGSLPGSSIPESKVQIVGLQINPTSVLVGQNVEITVNVTNIGGEQGSFSLNLLLDNSTYQTTQIKLSPAETKMVNFTVSGAAEGTHLVKISNLESSFSVLSRFFLSNLSVNRTEAKVGEAIGISVQITNKAQENGDYTLSLSINGAVAQTKTGQTESGGTSTILFEVTEQAEGAYQFAIGSLTGNFTITSAAPPPKPAEFQVANLTIDPEITVPGSTVNVTAIITNIGETSGSYTAEFKVNGDVRGTQTVQLSGGGTTSVSFITSQATKGTYTIAIGNATGTLSIQDASSVKLTSMIVRPYEVWAGDTVTVTIKGMNSAASASSISLKLKIGPSTADLQTVDTKTLSIAGGGDGSVDFSLKAPALQAGDSLTYLVDVNGMQGGFMVVKNGYHTLNVQITPRGDADFTITLPNGQTEPHKTFWSALLPEGTYVVTMPYQDPTGRVTFVSWDDGSTNLARTFTLNERMTITATYTGGSSCPSLYVWNGTGYVYVGDVSNHGWLGYINNINDDGSITYYRNNPWDYVPLNSSQLQATNGNYNLTLIQKWNEIFYLDQAYMVAVDHPANVDVYSTMVEQYLNQSYMGNIYTISKNPIPPVSAVNEKGENVLPKIYKIDGVFTSGGNGIQSPAWNNITWNRITLNLGNLTDSQQIKLVVRAIVDWGSADDYTTWLNGFFAQPVPGGTQITPPPYMEVKDANGNWIRIPEGREFPLPPDGVARTYVVDLTGLFPTKDYSLRISNFWNVTFDYIAVDTTPQQNITVQTINPQATLYKAFSAGSGAATGNFTKYGDVTQLLHAEDDMFAIGRQGDAVSLEFPISGLKSPAAGQIRDYFLYEACWFKDENGNWGFGFGFTVDPLPFRSMTGFPYPPNEYYPNDTPHQEYLRDWNNRTIQPAASASQSQVMSQNIFTNLFFPAFLLLILPPAIYLNYLGRDQFRLIRIKRSKRIK